jgi:hypothetical protein
MLKFILMVPLLVSLFFACNYAYKLFVPHSIVEVKYVANAESKPLRYVSVTLGGEKSGLFDVGPNQVKSIRMYPDKNILLVFAADVYSDADDSTDSLYSEENEFRGDDIRVRLTIDKKGLISSHQICKLPCYFN